MDKTKFVKMTPDEKEKEYGGFAITAAGVGVAMNAVLSLVAGYKALTSDNSEIKIDKNTVKTSNNVEKTTSSSSSSGTQKVTKNYYIY